MEAVMGTRGATTIVVGPVHAGIIEPGRFVFTSGGETVLELAMQLGFSHRGIEQALRGTGALAAPARVARICGACSAARSWAYARALEEIGGAICDESSELARAIVAELERAYNHAFDLASSCSAAGYTRGQMTGLRIKESLHRLNATHAGHRLLFDAIVPGGVRHGILHSPGDLRDALQSVRVDVDRFVDDVFTNESVRRRFEGTGKVGLGAARRLGAVGPTRRACGDALDERQLRRYGAYAWLRVRGSRVTSGDVEARCRVKADELVESLALCDEALRELGGNAPPPSRVLVLSAGNATGAVEGPRGTESVAVSCDDAGVLTGVAVQSASKSNWPLVVDAMNGNIVPDFPLVNKSFNLCYACADL
jgi:Ni,Fe-hydrogenase III large subunit